MKVLGWRMSIMHKVETTDNRTLCRVIPLFKCVRICVYTYMLGDTRQMIPRGFMPK